MATNGAQHLAALTRDNITAPLVNLVPSELPGDLYKYVGEHVWERVRKTLENYSEDEIQDCEKFIDDLIELRKELGNTESKSQKHEELQEKLKEFRYDNPELLLISAPVFWNRINDLKDIRKVVKRGTMTLPLICNA
jgi:hypothetical protein